MLASLNYKLSPDAKLALGEYISRRRTQPLFANARSIRNAFDRARLRQANRLFAEGDRGLILEALTTLEAEDIRRRQGVSAPGGKRAISRVTMFRSAASHRIANLPRSMTSPTLKAGDQPLPRSSSSATV